MATTVSGPRDPDGVGTILFIDDIDVTRPIFQRTIGSFRDVVNAQVPRRTLLFVESLGLHHADATTRTHRIIDRIANEYEQEPIDLLVATGDSSIAVAAILRARWGRDIPIIGLLTSQASSLPTTPTPTLSNSMVVRLGDMNGATARNIKALMPSLSELLIVGSTLEELNGAAASMRPILGSGVRLDLLPSPNLEDLAARFARLGPESAIVYLSVGRDSSGRVWQVREYLRRLIQIAPRPVFGWLASYMGMGIVGGPVIDGSEIGSVLGRLASEVLRGADPSRMQPVAVDRTQIVYDWLPLRRFGLPVDRLPEDATVLNRPLPVWKSYPQTSAAVGALIVALFGGIGVLVRNRRVVRRENAAQLAISRRLVQAQDEERVRIARDLHDDLCQEMTMLAIEVSRTPDESPLRVTLVTRVHDLIERTRRIAVGLHATHLGKMPFPDALAAHTAGLQERTGLDIRLEVPAWENEPAPAVALGLFRAVQEALQNVIRHADATMVTLQLEATAREFRIEVTDDGIGFEPADGPDAGMGLASMRERMASIGGTFAVRSAPFEGTTIQLAVPLLGERP